MVAGSLVSIGNNRYLLLLCSERRLHAAAYLRLVSENRASQSLDPCVCNRRVPAGELRIAVCLWSRLRSSLRLESSESFRYDEHDVCCWLRVCVLFTCGTSGEEVCVSLRVCGLSFFLKFDLTHGCAASGNTTAVVVACSCMCTAVVYNTRQPILPCVQQWTHRNGTYLLTVFIHVEQHG